MIYLGVRLSIKLITNESETTIVRNKSTWREWVGRNWRISILILGLGLSCPATCYAVIFSLNSQNGYSIYLDSTGLYLDYEGPCEPNPAYVGGGARYSVERLLVGVPEIVNDTFGSQRGAYVTGSSGYVACIPD